MLIQLRQPEIEEALKMYVTSQGFSLAGKQVDIAFTASRGNNGVTADLDINDVSGVRRVSQDPVVGMEVVPAASAEEVPAAEAKENPFAGSDEADAVEEATEATPAVSLFNS